MTRRPLLKSDSQVLDLSAISTAAESVQATLIEGSGLLPGFVDELPRFWDGKTAILEMKSAGFNQWKQMEWPGFYLEFLSRQILPRIFGKQSDLFGNTRFDGFLGVPWDLKCKGLTDPGGNQTTTMYLNDERATIDAIDRFGMTLLVVVFGEYTFDDENQTFYSWHESIKGPKSNYQLADPNRKSRRRKVGFSPNGLNLYVFTHEHIRNQANGFELRSQGKNSNGKPRPYKYLLDVAKFQPAASIIVQ